MKVLLLLFTLVASGSVLSADHKKSDHFDGKKFHNLEGDDLKSLWQVLKWKLGGEAQSWPTLVPNENFPMRELAPDEKLSATFINHATFFLQLPGLNVLTDPVYSERVSPFTFIGPKRVRPPGIPFDALPSIDVVLISHNHYDHLDIKSLQMIDDKFHPLFIVPLGNEKLMKEAGIQNVKSLDWWEEVRVKDTRFTFAPAQHWSNRTFWDKNETLWGSFMMDNGVSKIYFGGDTGYASHFRDVKTRLGAPDLALLPIGAYRPRWFMKFNHMDPEDAVKAHLDLGATKSLGMHFGTFQLTDEGIDEPIRDLETAKEKFGLPLKDFETLKEGQTYFL